MSSTSLIFVPIWSYLGFNSMFLVFRCGTHPEGNWCTGHWLMGSACVSCSPVGPTGVAVVCHIFLCLAHRESCGVSHVLVFGPQGELWCVT